MEVGRDLSRSPELAQYYSENTQDGRNYKHPLTGQRVPSITTCLKYESKDDLAQWKVDQSVRWCIDHWFDLGSRSTEDAFKTARWRHLDTMNERAEVGSGVHEYLESLHNGSWDFPVLDAEQDQIIGQFREFSERYIFEPVYNEVTVWSHSNSYAGTADALALVEGPGIVRGYYWIDYKTSRKVWPSHWMQLAALRNADVLMDKGSDGVWSETPLPETIGGLVLHLRSDFWEILPMENEQLRYRQFLLYRGLWHVNEELKRLEKEANTADF